jgi:hypothetical protein
MEKAGGSKQSCNVDPIRESKLRGHAIKIILQQYRPLLRRIVAGRGHKARAKSATLMKKACNDAIVLFH